MIDTLKFMDDLKEIKQMVNDQKPRYLIVDKCNDKIAGYQLEVEEFEKWAVVQNDAYLEGTVVSDTSDSPFLVHPGAIPGEKSEWNQQFYRGLTNKTFSCIV